MKYSYNANPGRPGGFDELTIKQGEHVYFHEVNSSNPHWVKAENEQGKIGHVPASYIMVGGNSYPLVSLTFFLACMKYFTVHVTVYSTRARCLSW